MNPDPGPDPGPATVEDAVNERLIEAVPAGSARHGAERLTEPVPRRSGEREQDRPTEALAVRPRTAGSGDRDGTAGGGEERSQGGNGGQDAGDGVAKAAGERDTEAAIGDGPGRADVPDLMVLPDPPSRRNAVPEQSSTPAFWLTAMEAGETDPEASLARLMTATEERPPVVVARGPRRPAGGLAALLLLALVATFFAWVSAEPIWLAVGHGETGVASVTRCSGDGIGQRCIGTFSSDGRIVRAVKVLGAAGHVGAAVPARMVNLAGDHAYAGAAGWTLHLRWTIGVVLTLLCGLGIASATGARRLETARARRRAVLLSLAAPVLLLIGFLAAAY